jgi:hypothetical protein
MQSGLDFARTGQGVALAGQARNGGLEVNCAISPRSEQLATDSSQQGGWHRHSWRKKAVCNGARRQRLPEWWVFPGNEVGGLEHAVSIEKPHQFGQRLVDPMRERRAAQRLCQAVEQVLDFQLWGRNDVPSLLARRAQGVNCCFQLLGMQALGHDLPVVGTFDTRFLNQQGKRSHGTQQWLVHRISKPTSAEAVYARDEPSCLAQASKRTWTTFESGGRLRKHIPHPRNTGLSCKIRFSCVAVQYFFTIFLTFSKSDFSLLGRLTRLALP